MIGGDWIDGDDVLDVVDPATEEVLAVAGTVNCDIALGAADGASAAF